MDIIFPTKSTTLRMNLVSNKIFILLFIAYLGFLSLACTEAQSSFQYDSNGNLTNVAGAVSEPLTASVSPTTQYVSVGADAALSVSVNGARAMSYQWFLNGLAVQGATGSTLFIPSVTTSNLGNYTVVVCDGSDCVTNAVPALLEFNKTWVASGPGDWFNPVNWSPPRGSNGHGGHRHQLGNNQSQCARNNRWRIDLVPRDDQ